MKSEDILYRDQYNIIDRENPPKSIFTVEKTYRKNYKSIQTFKKRKCKNRSHKDTSRPDWSDGVQN